MGFSQLIGKITSFDLKTQSSFPGVQECQVSRKCTCTLQTSRSCCRAVRSILGRQGRTTHNNTGDQVLVRDWDLRAVFPDSSCQAPSYEPEVGKLWLAISLCVSHELRMVFTFLNGWKIKRRLFCGMEKWYEIQVVSVDIFIGGPTSVLLPVICGCFVMAESTPESRVCAVWASAENHCHPCSELLASVVSSAPSPAEQQAWGFSSLPEVTELDPNTPFWSQILWF